MNPGYGASGRGVDPAESSREGFCRVAMGYIESARRSPGGLSSNQGTHSRKGCFAGIKRVAMKQVEPG
jgi:hypothetical protein